MANYKQPGYDPSKNGYWKGTVDGAPNFGYPKNYFYADEWMTIKEYESMNGWGQNNDRSIEFGSKVLIDKDGNPYSAYYSQYSEEGNYTSDSAKYPSPSIDYYYNIETDNGFRPKFDFSGGKYF